MNGRIADLMIVKGLSRSDIPTSECEVILDYLIRHDMVYLGELRQAYYDAALTLDEQLQQSKARYNKEISDIREAHRACLANLQADLDARLEGLWEGAK